MDIEEVDYKTILEGCGVGKVAPCVVVENLAKLEEIYDSAVLVSMHNYLLVNINEPEILMAVIKYSDTHKSLSTLIILQNKLEIMGTISDVENEDILINLKVAIIKAIASYRENSSVKVLLACLNNKAEHYKIRLACADALGRIGNKYAVKPLINLVEDEEEKSVYLKESATFALGMLGDISAIDPLISILESKHGVLDKFSFLKEKIVEALGKLNLNNSKVMRALKSSLMDSSPMVRINAIEAIMNSENSNSIELIKPCLNDEDDEVKRNALIALYNLIGRDILDEVIELPIYTKFLKEVAQELIDDYEVTDE